MTEKDKKRFLKYLRMYSAYPSLSCQEEVFFNAVMNDLRKASVPLSGRPHANDDGIGTWTIEYRYHSFWYAAFLPAQHRRLKYVPSMDDPMEMPPLPVFVVHLDRVPGYAETAGSVAMINTIHKDSLQRPYVQGQLDNIISLTIFRYLLDEGRYCNLLLTTDEERGGSWPQLEHFASRHKDVKFISVDIDVFNEREHPTEVLNKITIRDRDEDAVFDPRLVGHLRSCAASINIDTEKEKGYAIVEPGKVARYTGNKITGAHIGLPLLNYHTKKEIVQWKAIEDAIQLIRVL